MSDTFVRAQSTVVDVGGELFYVEEVYDPEWKTWDAKLTIEEFGEKTAEGARRGVAEACRRFADAVLGSKP